MHCAVRSSRHARMTPFHAIDNLGLTIHDCSVDPPRTARQVSQGGTAATGVRSVALAVAYVDMAGAKGLHNPQECRQIYRSGRSVQMDTARGSAHSAWAHALAYPELGLPMAQVETDRLATSGTAARRLVGMSTQWGSDRTRRPLLHACPTPRGQTYSASKARVGAVERTGPQAILTDFVATAPAVGRRSCNQMSVAVSRRTRGAANPSATTADSGRVTHIPPVGHAAFTLTAEAQGHAAQGLRIPRTASVTPETARGTRRTR